MKLLAVRAAAFRRFAQGVAVEAFGPGTNLLAGPNELGKSTLFQALEAAFLLKHGTTGAVLESLRPRGGGEPLVEADFEIGGRRWRIRKQFGRGKGAVLTDLDAGRVVARSGEAEDQLAALTGVRSDLPGRIGLVWVRQQRALRSPDLDIEPETGKSKMRGEANALVELLNAEVIEAAGSGLAERIAKRAQAELETYITPGRAGARKNGPYDKALAAREHARTGLERARSAVRSSQERLERIAKGTAMLAEAEDPAIKAPLTQKVALLEKAISEAGAQRERDKGLADKALACDLEAKDAHRAVAEARREQIRARELADAYSKAQSLQEAIAALSRDLNANSATPARLAELESALSLARRDEQALEDMSTFVDIDPAAGAEGRIVAGGTKVEVHTRLAVPEQLTLTIAGVGTIRVTSSDAKRAAAAKQRREEQLAIIAGLLAVAAVNDADGFRALAAARQATAVHLEEARRALSVLAPQGIALLREEMTSLQAAVASRDIAALEKTAGEKDVLALAARHTLEQAKATILDERRYERMSEELEALRRDLQKRDGDARRFSEHLERLKGEQDIADQEAGSTDLEAAGAELQRAEDEVRRCEDEIAALKLLSETLQGVVENVRSRYLEPVTRAFLPALTQVFPGAAADFREGFSLQALTRAGEQEEFATLSDGTREQLAVLVRLGFARLFAERGAPVPLVLDDPLVYSDDERLAAMCTALSEAGRSHQVVVLTCRQSAFEQLEAHRLTLQPWRDAAT